MIEQVQFLETCRQRLEPLVARSTYFKTDEPVWWEKFVDKSLLQKSIRRGLEAQAIAAADRLFSADERSLWLRLSIIALEDIGVANVELIAQVLLAASDRSLRDKLGGSRHVALCLVSEMCLSRKDRSTDDLIDAIGCTDLYGCVQARISELDDSELFDLIASDDTDVPTRALAALWSQHGSFETSMSAAHRAGWHRVLHWLAGRSFSCEFEATAQLGLQVTKSVMAPFLALLSAECPSQSTTADDAILPFADLNGLPSWALDGHTRIGLHAFRLYRTRSPRMYKLLQNWSTGEVSPAKTIGGLVFRADSEQLAKRLQWDLGLQLRNEARSNRPGLVPGAPAEALQTVLEEWDLITQCRADAVAHYLR